VSGCRYLDCETKSKARGLCERHARQAEGGLLGLDSVKTVGSWDDGVRAPEDLPIKPKQVGTVRVSRNGRPARDLWAVVMPYPSLDGTQPCQGYEDLFDDETRDRGGSKKGLVEAVALCNKCPFQTQCFEWAMAHEEFGFWAGATKGARAQIRERRGQILVTLGVEMQVNSPFRERNWAGQLERARNAWNAADPEVEEVDVDEWETAAV
jgi:hypothetical protein